MKTMPSIPPFAARLRPLGLSLLTLTAAALLSGCDLLDQISAMIDSSKGSRSIQFLIMEPFKVDVDGTTITKTVGFDAETTGLESNLRSGVMEAAGRRHWGVAWYNDRQPLADFYAKVTAQQDDPKRVPKDHLTAVRLLPDYKDCETMIYTLVENDPSRSDFLTVWIFGYDIAENQRSFIRRTIKRDQSTARFKEEVGALTRDLCERMYGSNSN